MSPLYIAGVLLITIGFVHCGVILPYFPRDSEAPELWEMDNLVEPPPNLMMFPHIYNHDRQRAKIPPHDRLKSLIKAIYQYEATHDLGDKRKGHSNFFQPKEEKSLNNQHPAGPLTSPILNTKAETPVIVVAVETRENIKPDDSIFTTENSNSNEYDGPEPKQTTFIDVTSTEANQPEQPTQKPEVLLEDLVDSIAHIPSILASDKSHTYTHSIRHGYGVPMHYSHSLL